MPSFTALILATLAVLATQSSSVAGATGSVGGPVPVDFDTEPNPASGSPLGGTVPAPAPPPDASTPPATPLGPEPVFLGVASNFTILSKSGITNVPTSAITGNVGASPITGAAIHLECSEVDGEIYSVDATGPACKITDDTMLTEAVSDMEAAYTDAAGRKNPDHIEFGAGEIGGRTLEPGLYKWSTSVGISNDVMLNGNTDDVYIFQIAGDLMQAANKRVLKSETLQASNIFWQVAGVVSVGTDAHFEGITLCSTEITLKTSSSVNGRLLAQTAVTLQKNAVTEP